MTPKEYITQLEETIKQLIHEKEQADLRIQSLEHELQAVKQRLRLYENPNTPPSAARFPKKPKK